MNLLIGGPETDEDTQPLQRPKLRDPVRRRTRAPYVVQGGLSGTLWYGGRSVSVLGYPRWRLWLKDAVRFGTLEAAEVVAKAVGGRVEVKP